MRIGFDHYTIEHRELSAQDTLDFARDHQLDGVQFLEPAAIDPELNQGRLAAFRQQADDMGLYLEIGLPSPNPVRRSRELERAVSPAEHARELCRHVAAASALGCRAARAFVGDRHDRFRTDTPWDTQRKSTLDVLRHLAPCLRDHDVRIAIETHADLTSGELLEMLRVLGPEVAGVTLDTGNLVMRLEDPLEAVERLAPHVLMTHIKDAVLAFTSRGLCWQARPVGSGILPIPDMLTRLTAANPGVNLTVELHPRTYDLPIYDRTWLGFFPHLRPEGLAGIVRLAVACERGYSEGSLERPEALEGIPWPDRDLDWLARSVGYLRTMVTMLERI